MYNYLILHGYQKHYISTAALLEREHGKNDWVEPHRHYASRADSQWFIEHQNYMPWSPFIRQ